MRWEYRIVYLWDGKVKDGGGKEDEGKYLNRMGDDGWELVTVAAVGRAHWLYFKRPRPQERPANHPVGSAT